MLEVLIVIGFASCMVCAALSDMLSMTISNRLSLALVAIFAAVAPFADMDWASYGWHFAAGAVVLGATFSMFSLGVMGGGDAKLIAATAVWMGLNGHLMDYLLASALAGGVLALFIIIYRRSTLAASTGRNMFLRNLADPQKGVPYGIALGIGGLFAFPASPLGAFVLQGLVGQ